MLGRLISLLQFLKFNRTRPLRRSIDNGSSTMAVPSKCSSNKCSIFPLISGNFFNLKQPERIRTCKDGISMLIGSVWRPMQSFIFKMISRLRRNIDGWTSIKLVQPSRTSFSRFGALVKSGVLRKACEWLRLINFNPSKVCWKHKKEKS